MDEEIKAHEADNENDEDEQQENAKLQKRLVQMQYLEQENNNLALENDDLNTTLKINKDIIKSILQGDKKFDSQFEYTLA